VPRSQHPAATWQQDDGDLPVLDVATLAFALSLDAFAHNPVPGSP
jgi:hypothetical protein